MRFNVTALGLLLPIAAVLSGCGMGSSGTLATAPSTAAKIQGKAFGGQQPVANSIIALYAFGTSGYGSRGQLLAQTTTGSDGYFNIDPNSINCPTPDTPVYILSMGGDPGFGPNPAIMLGSGLGACSTAVSDPNDFVTINEVSTAAMAYTFSHFFSAALTTDTVTQDHFGAPAGATSTVTLANTATLRNLLDVENGYPHPNTSTFRFEGAKLISFANILGACVNSIGPASPSCSALFRYITGPNGAVPTNTLEAAVYLALNPRQNIQYIYALQPPSGAAAFTGGLTSSPADWSLSASYISPNFGLGVNTRTTSTIDIDLSGRVWFPSNAPGKAGVGYFDPSINGFSPLFPGNLQHPQQVAIDIDNYVWANDNGSPNIAGYPPSSPTTPTVLSVPGSTSTSVTVAYDNTIRYGIVAASGLPALGKVTGKNTYAEIGGTEVPGGGGFIVASLAGDVIGGAGVSGQYLPNPTTYDGYFNPSNGFSGVVYQSAQDSGQIVFTGNNFVTTRGGYGPGNDGICIFSMQGCYGMADDGVRHPSGMSIDGASALWLADNFLSTIEEITPVNGSYLNGNYQANNVTFLHDNNNGGTMPSPSGIAVDGAGNIWVSNAGCVGNGCTPGSFTLTEIIGLATPTITPVSRQVVINDLAGTEPQVKTTTSAK